MRKQRVLVVVTATFFSLISVFLAHASEAPKSETASVVKVAQVKPTLSLQLKHSSAETNIFSEALQKEPPKPSEAKACGSKTLWMLLNEPQTGLWHNLDLNSDFYTVRGVQTRDEFWYYVYLSKRFRLFGGIVAGYSEHEDVPGSNDYNFFVGVTMSF